MGILDEISKGLQELGQWATEYQRQRIAVWQAVAARRGGRYNPRQTGFLSGSPASIDAPVRDVAVHVDTYTVSSKNSSTTYTRFQACYILPVGPVFRVFPEHVFSGIAEALGFEDVTLGGNQHFDARFVVRTADAQATRLVWTPTAKDRMLRWFPAGSVVADSRRVKLATSGVILEADRLEVGIDLVAEIAAYGTYWVDALRGLPGAVWVPPEGSWEHRTPPSAYLDVRGTRVWVYPVLSGVALTFCVASEIGRDVAPCELEVKADGTVTPEPPEELLPPGARGLLARAGEATLAFDGRWLRLTLAGNLDESRVVAATHVVAEAGLGTTAQGVYR